ncbi:MAG: serine/threonine protein kinase, partial [Gemmatimonadota bacterium]
SLGCVLFECLAGRPPFVASREELILSMHHQEKAPDVTQFRKDAPEGLVGLVTRALQKERGERWQTAAEMAAALGTG